jgi:uncharacterized radical SAM superfamily Fe-S cluster-containing enzyme
MNFFLGVTNKCNMTCKWCAHQRIRNENPTYEMSKEEFFLWQRYTKKASYQFDTICIMGFGEPTCYSDIDFLKYILISSRSFSRQIELLSNGKNVRILKELVKHCDIINISVWDDIDNELLELSKQYKQIHFRTNIKLHDVSTKYTEIESNEYSKCGCSGCGYSMNTVFLACGTWSPEIVKNGIYHSELKDYYLDKLDKNYGYTAYEMCKRCHANTSIPYKPFNK